MTPNLTSARSPQHMILEGDGACEALSQLSENATGSASTKEPAHARLEHSHDRAVFNRLEGQEAMPNSVQHDTWRGRP